MEDHQERLVRSDTVLTDTDVDNVIATELAKHGMQNDVYLQPLVAFWHGSRMSPCKCPIDFPFLIKELAKHQGEPAARLGAVLGQYMMTSRCGLQYTVPDFLMARKQMEQTLTSASEYPLLHTCACTSPGLEEGPTLIDVCPRLGMVPVAGGLLWLLALPQPPIDGPEAACMWTKIGNFERLVVEGAFVVAVAAGSMGDEVKLKRPLELASWKGGVSLWIDALYRSIDETLRVSLRDSLRAVQLAELGVGDSFGQCATLIQKGVPRQIVRLVMRVRFTELIDGSAECKVQEAQHWLDGEKRCARDLFLACEKREDKDELRFALGAFQVLVCELLDTLKHVREHLAQFVQRGQK